MINNKLNWAKISRRMLMRLLIVTSFLTLIVYFAYASSNGSKTGRTSTTSSGCDCHNNLSTATTVSASSPSGWSVAAGGTLNITITVNAAKPGCGIDIAVKTSATGSTNAGALSPGVGSGLQLYATSGELTHAGVKTMTAGACSWNFTWTAPATAGTYYLRAVANAVDNSGDENGDLWNFMPVQTITVTPASSSSITITSPVGGENLCAGSSSNITWTSTGVTNVNLTLSTDGGSTFPTTIASNVSAAAGSYAWAVPGSVAGANLKVKITDAASATNSVSPSAFTVKAPASITTQPQNVTVCDGAQATLSVAATGTGITYQWRKGGSPISGANSASYVISAVTPSSAGSYDCVITGCNSVTTNAATLTVNAGTLITTQPQNVSACDGGQTSFTVAANGTGTLTYQWRKGGTPINGATSATYTINPVSSASAGSYDCVVTGCNSATSNAATLTVTNATQITNQPQSVIACEGGQAVFTVAATGSGLTYQWRKGGTAINGATSATYTINPVATGSAGSYDCVVTGCTVVTSAAATLSVSNATQITTQPQNATACEGGQAVLTVVASGSGINYQWRKNGVVIPNSNVSNLIINPVLKSSAGSYDCVVSGCSSVTSAAATLSVDAAVLATSWPKDTSLCENVPLVLHVVATGVSPSYQWKKNGVNINNATSADYTINSLTLADAGSYSVLITDKCGSVQTPAAVLTVNPGTTINTQPKSQSVQEGSNVDLTIAVTGNNLKYQWRKNSTNINGATSATFSLASVKLTDAATYDCVVGSACGNITSAAATLQVTPKTSGPALTLLNSSLDYGIVLVNSSKDSIFTDIIKNSGDAELTITQINLTGSKDFTLDPITLPLKLAPNATKTLAFKFTPSSAAVQTTTVNFVSDSKTSATLTLTGKGGAINLTASVPSITIESAAIGEQKESMVDLTNDGDYVAKVTLNISGADAGKFKIIASGKDLVIPAKSKTSFVVAYTPTSNAQATALLEITGTNYTGTIKIDLTGKVKSTGVDDLGTLETIKTFPQPFSENVNIEINGLKNAGVYTLYVYNYSGLSVNTLNKEINNESAVFVWNGANYEGDKQPSGKYIIRIVGPGFDKKFGVDYIK